MRNTLGRIPRSGHLLEVFQAFKKEHRAAPHALGEFQCQGLFPFGGIRGLHPPRDFALAVVAHMQPRDVSRRGALVHVKDGKWGNPPFADGLRGLRFRVKHRSRVGDHPLIQRLFPLNQQWPALILGQSAGGGPKPKEKNKRGEHENDFPCIRFGFR